jgi:aryl-alcohol dehydrogenase-like predicted oxidoreductase
MTASQAVSNTVTERVELGHSGVFVPRLGLGTTAIGGLYTPVGDALAAAVVRRAAQLGLRHFDTAPLYGYGLAERRLGTALRGVNRSDYVLSTKVGRLLVPGGNQGQPQWAETGDLAPVFNFSYQAAMQSLEQSLDRLGVQQVDIAHLHDPDDHYHDARDGAYRALLRLRASGEIRAIGAGMNQAEMLTRFVRDVDLDCVLLAGRYTLLDQSGLRSLLPLCIRRGVSVIIGGVYNSGILADPTPGARYDYEPAGRAILGKVLQIRAVCRRHNVPLKAAAIQFPFGHSAIACVIVGARTPHEVEENLRMFHHPIPPEFWADLKRTGLLGSAVPTP